LVIKYSFALYYYYYYFKLKQNLETKVYVGWPSMISRDWCFTLGNVYSLRVAELSSFMVVFFVLAIHFVWILIIANHWGSYFVWRLDYFLFGKVTISSSIMIECWKMVLLRFCFFIDTTVKSRLKGDGSPSLIRYCWMEITLQL
jgi:hypothetical protein